MAQITLNVGTNANDGTGDTLRDAMISVNTMFTEVFSAPGISSDAILIADNTISAIRSDDDLIFNPSGTGSVTFPAIRFNDNNIEGTRSNEDINIIPAGTGTVVFGALSFSGNNITSTRSNDNINLIPAGTGSVIIGAINFSGTSIFSDDSSIININENLIVDGTANVTGTTTLTGAVTASSTLGVTGAATLSNNLTVTGTSTLTTTNIDNLTIQDNIISSASNADINITPGGTGSVVLGSIKINDNNIEGINSNEDIKLIPSGTGTVVISNLTIDENINITDNKIKTTASNSNLELSGSGSGTVDIKSSLVTAAVTTVGNWSVTGTHTISGQLDVDYVRIKDNVITTNASNADLIISASSSGNVIIDDVDIGGGNIDNTIIGAATPLAGTFTTLSATTSAVIDGVTITDNTISTNASNAPLELTGNGSGGVNISGFTFPTSDGSSGQFISTNGLGILSFATAGATLNYSDIADATTTVGTSTTTVINTFAHASYRSCKYFISITDATNTRYEVLEANVTHDGTNAFISTFGSTTNYTGGLATYTADINGSNVEVKVTNISADTCVFKFQRIAIDV